MYIRIDLFGTGMAKAKKAQHIGFRQGRQLCQMPPQKRLECIAEGLPIIFESARSLVNASQALHGFPREAEILESHAEEECAKILILIDIVRCPPSLIAARIGPMMKWFYDHLARLIYSKAQMWKPGTATKLQEYIDTERPTHYLEGEYGEFVAPNWELFKRESALYADLMGNEEGDPSWISPARETIGFPALLPISFLVTDALSAFGIYTIEGLKILHKVWHATDVKGDVGWDVARDLYSELTQKLDAAGLITDRATSNHAHALVNFWQLPMYNMDLAPIPVTLDELLGRQK